MNNTNVVAKPARAAVAQQPSASIQMVPTSAPAVTRQHTEQCKASRIRGGGSSRDCFLGLIECFLCFECCKDCCECWADIICCPCETIESCCC